MDKKVITALAASLFILVGYQFLVTKLYPQLKQPSQQPKMVAAEAARPVPENIVPKEEILDDKEVIVPGEKEVVFENKLYRITFTSAGAGIKNITLKENIPYGINIPYEIFNTDNRGYSLFLFSPDKTGSELNNSTYDVVRSGEDVIFTHPVGADMLVEKTFRFHNSLYRIDLDIKFKNKKSGSVTKEYALVSGVHFPMVPMDERFFEISADLDNKISKDKKHSKPFTVQKTGNLSWIMLKNRYFSIITKPFIQSSGYSVAQNQSGKIITAVNIPEFTVGSNSEITHNFGLYVGPSDLGLLRDANISADKALSYGFFGSISQILVSSLRFFHKIVKNWGVAILLLTIFMNLALFPLTRKSYQSMHDMQMLQPKINKLREEFKNNPQKLQKEIMEMYKKNKVNPMGGCLPMLLQMPIFIALYNGLMHSVELRGAKFLWVKDLSTTENIPIPFTIPLIGNTINILPLLMLVAMFFQQKLSNQLTAMSQTAEQKQQQKFMTIMMTGMFGFIFYNFPSGLVLYWFGNTVIMALLQYFFTKSPATAEQNA